MVRGCPVFKRTGTSPNYGVGYTIIEVLLFVALTSFLLIIAIANINGGQKQVQFSQGVRDFGSELSDIINDIPTGFFPTNNALTCTVGGSRPTIDDGGGSGLGKDDKCIYVGKALQFRPDGDDSKVLVYTLAGQRLTAAGDLVTSIDEAAPVAVANPADPTFQDTIEEIPLRNGVRISRIFNGDAPTPLAASMQYGVIAIVTTFEGTTPTGDVSQAVQIGAVRDTTIGSTKLQAYNMINKLQTTSPGNNGELVKATGGIVICLESDNNKKASIVVGTNGSAGTKFDIDSYDQRCD